MSWLGKRFKSFGFAFKGIWYLFRFTPNALIHLLAVAVVVVAGILFGVSPLEWCALILCMGSVIAAEAVNSALESLADKVSPEKDPLIGRAKDLGAGAVLILALMSVAVACFIFIPKF